LILVPSEMAPFWLLASGVSVAIPVFLSKVAEPTVVKWSVKLFLSTTTCDVVGAIGVGVAAAAKRLTANRLKARTLVVLVGLVDSLATGAVTTLSEAVCVILSFT
jgi:hypothetical protein